MDILWAPWRMEYIKAAQADPAGCIFCPMVPPGDDRQRLILHRGRHSFLVLNRYPYNPGHLMVVPYQHVGRMHDLSPEVWGEILGQAGRAVGVFQTTLKADGANCGINIGRVAGAGVTDHIHFHVVPRWQGDMNFLPVVAATKSMPEYLAATYDQLKGGF